VKKIQIQGGRTVNIREAVFAGSWYPKNASACIEEIEKFLSASTIRLEPEIKCVGGIVPHAGWFFSGHIACNVIQCLSDGDKVDAVVLFGMHLHPSSPMYIMTDGAWETPMGNVPVAEEIAKELVGHFEFDSVNHFSHDNTIELQMPFIKYFFPDAKILPIGVPPVERSLEVGKTVAEIAERQGKTIKVIGSTDLTHYGLNYGFLPKGIGPDAVDWVCRDNDRKIIDAMVSMNPERVIHEALEHQNACCAGAAAAAISAARQLGAEKAQCVVYASSYEKSPGDSFVGYAGIIM